LANISKQKTSFTNIIGKVANLAKSAKMVMVAKALATKKPPKEAFECV
jgi:hypothetical protein